jgi:hypothetical protein
MAQSGERLPNLIIIGAAKAGTTSLHHYLNLHPEIGMSSVKETYFFERDDYLDALDEYERYFPRGVRVRGEATPSYAQHPRVTGIPERIRSVAPDAKLIYCVRDPIERAEADYHQHVAEGAESRPIEEAFADLEPAANVYACCSSYALQLRRYLEAFPLEQVKVVESRDLAQRTQATLSEIFAFLGVAPTFASEQFGERLNAKDGKARLSPLGARMRESRLAAAGRGLLPQGARRRLYSAARRGLSREVRRVPLPDAVRGRLADALGDDVADFRALTGRSFAHWSI